MNAAPMGSLAGKAEGLTQPTPDQDLRASAVMGRRKGRITYADAFSMVRLFREGGDMDRIGAINSMVCFGIPFAEAEIYADEPGMRAALLARIQRAWGGHPL